MDEGEGKVEVKAKVEGEVFGYSLCSVLAVLLLKYISDKYFQEG